MGERTHFSLISPSYAPSTISAAKEHTIKCLRGIYTYIEARIWTYIFLDISSKPVVPCSVYIDSGHKVYVRTQATRAFPEKNRTRVMSSEREDLVLKIILGVGE